MNAAALLNGVRDGNDHVGGIRCLKLFRLEEAYFSELRDEVARLIETECASDVCDPRHITNWTKPRGEVLQFSLLNISGSYDDFTTDHNLSKDGKHFHGPQCYASLSSLVSALPDLVNLRINVLGPGASLSAHEEHAIVRVRGKICARVRFHLPVITNPRAELTLDGHVYHLLPGTIYFINHGCVHSACNNGPQQRVHLVWDMLLTREVFDAMFGAGDLPLPLRQIPEEEQLSEPLRKERVGAFERIPPSVTPEETARLGF
jgi:hypothetical protein